MIWNNLEIPDNPYFHDEDVVIYHADCRDILPELPKVDLVLTDPPYTGMDSKTTIMMQNGVAKCYTPTKTVGDIWGASHEWIDIALPKADKGLMVFCSYHSIYEIPQMVNINPTILITWYKRNSPPSRQNAPHYTTEFIWAFRTGSGLNWHNLESLYDIPKLATGCMATERFVDKNGCAIHPTQKPISLMKELLKVEPETILDPFLGSGTTLRAAKDLGRKAIGIEIEERYCEIAAKRMAQSVMELNI